MACFSLQIPNPLFDLAGITCGHFLVPFWTFFGATVIGKAIIKMHIQVQPDKHVTSIIKRDIFLIFLAIICHYCFQQKSRGVGSRLNRVSKTQYTLVIYPQYLYFRLIPYIGPYLRKPFSEYLETQKQKFHAKPGTDSTQVQYIT